MKDIDFDKLLDEVIEQRMAAKADNRGAINKIMSRVYVVAGASQEYSSANTQIAYGILILTTLVLGYFISGLIIPDITPFDSFGINLFGVTPRSLYIFNL